MMKNAKQTKRRRRLGTSNPVGNDVAANEEDEEGKVPKALVEAFSLASLHDAISSYRQVNEDQDKAAHIFGERVPDIADYPSANWTSGASSSGSSEGFVETGCVQNVVNEKGFRGRKQKRVVAATGTVSTVLGKEYVKSRPIRRDPNRFKGLKNGFFETKEAEQFLCSMLGDECELSMAVVRDVFCQCGYDVEKSGNGRYLDNTINYKEDIRFLIERKDSFTDRASDCTSRSSESEALDNIWSMGNGHRNYAKVLAGSEADSTPNERSTELDLPQKVLESLFHISKSPDHEPKTMNWKNVVKKLQSLGPRFDVCPSSFAEPQQDTCAKGDEYHVFRKTSQQHWDSMRSYNQKAAVAFSKGERHHAAYLSEQGKVQTKLAREADERASHDIFKARNKGIENVITIDLHGQHVKQAMQYVKTLLLLGSYVPSVQTLRLITGSGSHGVGKSKVKQSVITLMQKEGIKWSEENQGTLLIKLSGSREFTFMDSESDTE